MKHLLELQSIQKSFSGIHAVDDVGFSVEAGSIFGLLGPNGAGKTTLIRMITGIFLPDSGSIQFGGQPFEALRDSAQIGYMPEERGLYKKMKIGEQVLYLARLKGLSKADATEKIKKWFIKLEMESWWNKKVEDLSKGMSQKLQFVTTVVHEPKLIILDEPFSGLDPVNANLIKEEIYNLAKQGSTILFSTHRMEQVEEICQHVVLINKGKKILDGTVNEIRQNHKENIFSIELDNTDHISDNPLFQIIRQSGNHIQLSINNPSESNQVLKYFIDNGKQILSFHEILPSLNEIFIRLVEEKSATRKFESTT